MNGYSLLEGMAPPHSYLLFYILNNRYSNCKMDKACIEFNKSFKWLVKTALSCSDGDTEVQKAHDAIMKVIRYNPDVPIKQCADAVWSHREIIMNGDAKKILSMQFDTSEHKNNKENINIDHVVVVLKNTWPDMDVEEQNKVIGKVQSLVPAVAKYEKARRETKLNSSDK